MKRVEIIANCSVEDNIQEALNEKGLAKFYTKIPVVHGVGSKGPRMGDAVWPEENFVMVVWCDDDEASKIKSALEPIKEHYPNEGIKVFSL
jgi:nitrogen regulatory protein PII